MTDLEIKVAELTAEVHLLRAQLADPEPGRRRAACRCSDPAQQLIDAAPLAPSTHKSSSPRSVINFPFCW